MTDKQNTIPGCYCRQCKWLKPDDTIKDLWWCDNPNPDAHATGFASLNYGCVFGELKEDKE